MKGHFDYSFAVAWHPDGNCFATGNQVSNAVLRMFLETAENMCHQALLLCCNPHIAASGLCGSSRLA